MSKTVEGMDLLTPCHSLLDILSYVDYKDIQNIKLVSRPLYGFIENHGIRLPRFKMTKLNFEFDDKRLIGRDVVFLKLEYREWSEEKQLLLFPHKFRFEICITDRRIRIWDCPQPLLHKLKENDLTSVESSSLDDEDIMNILVGYYHNKCHQDFRIKSVEEGMEMILSVIFRCFYFGTIYIKNKLKHLRGSRREEWFELIGNLFQKLRSKCRLVEAETHALGMQSLYFKFDPLQTILKNTSVRDLLHFQSLDKRFWVFDRFDDITSLQPVVHLLQKWITGEIQIKSLLIFFGSLHRPPNDQVLNAIKVLSVEYVEYKQLEGIECMMVKIKSPLENSYIYVVHSKSIMSIRDFASF